MIELFVKSSFQHLSTTLCDFATYLSATHDKDDETAVHFKIKRSTQMKKLMKAFCEQRSLPQGSIRFYFDGVRIGEGSTPTDVR